MSDPVPTQTSRSRSTTRRVLEATAWWAATLITLVILDDLTFGPFFWAISRLLGPLAAVGAVYAIYIPVQVFLVRRATAETQGRFAGFFLRRLELDRRSPAIAERETQLKQRVAGSLSAVVMSLVIGGVLPPLLLWRGGYSVEFVRRLTYITAVVYATEFALLHGLVPSLV